MELTKEDIHNLLVFLERATMQGNEAVAYIMLREKLKMILNQKEDAVNDTEYKSDSANAV